MRQNEPFRESQGNTLWQTKQYRIIVSQQGIKAGYVPGSSDRIKCEMPDPFTAVHANRNVHTCTQWPTAWGDSRGGTE